MINVKIVNNSDEVEDIKKCLSTLYSTRAGTQPLDRNFGINYSAGLDYPKPVSENLYAVEIINKTELYEKRVKVKKVTFTSDEGMLIPNVTIALIGDD